MNVSVRLINGLKLGFEIIDQSILAATDTYSDAQLGLMIEFLFFSFLIIKK